ncbi:hypothetical protein F2Q70_00029608 [Brassica cretica]|nr:hypothetical protein F2Q70_00029608 [Brassica cretica]
MTLGFLTSPVTRSRKKTGRDLDIELDWFIGDLQRLGSSLQQTANSKERERETQARGNEREEKRETLAARVFRFLWNSAGLRSDF